MKYSIKDVARIAGVSPSTVSRTINGTAYVDPIKKQKVLETIEKLNYVPNFAGKSLKDGSSGIIGVILPDFVNPYYTKLSQYLEQSIDDQQYLMLLALSHYDIELEKKYIERLSHGIADGIIIIPSESSTSSSYLRENIPTVVINRKTDIFDNVRLDNEKAAYDSMSYLIRMGHRKIVSYIGDMSSEIYHERKKGIIRAFEENGLSYEDTNIIENILDVKQAYEITNKVIVQPDRPTAIFSTMDILVTGIYSSIKEHNLNIPNDISVMGFDNILVVENLIPPLTTYENPADILAKNAVGLLVNRIHNKGERKGIVVEGEIIERDSVLKL